MKHLLLTTIAAVVLVGCGTTQQSVSPAESKPVTEAATPQSPTAEAPRISIHDVVKGKNIEAVKQHIAAGTDVNTKDEDGYTLLTVAAAYGSKEIVELLIFNGVDVNAKNEAGNTPLHNAAAQGHKEIAELLITNGANVNAKGVSSKTPLDTAEELAALYGNRRMREKSIKMYEVANLLLKHGGKTGEELKAEGK